MSEHPGGADGPARSLPPHVIADQARLQGSIGRLLQTVAALTDDDILQPSLLPGWDRAHVLTHLSRAADARTGLLAAARAGIIGRQYPSEESRAREIEAGAGRPAPVIRADLGQALERFRAAADDHPADRWDALGEWLGATGSPSTGCFPGCTRKSSITTWT